MSGVPEDIWLAVLPIRAPIDSRGAHQLPDLWQVPQSTVQFAPPHGEPAPHTQGPAGRDARLPPLIACELWCCAVGPAQIVICAPSRGGDTGSQVILLTLVE